MALPALSLVLACAGSGAHALEEPADEIDKLKACESHICAMILGKEPQGEDLKCDIQKTWSKSSLKGGESKGIQWGFGDAQCKANINLSRADVVNALTLPKYTIRIAPHTVKCVVERDNELKPVVITLAPKLEFKNGRAEKVWINLKEMEGPEDIKGTVWLAAELEDSLGLFHRQMIKQINKFVSKQCAKKYGPGGTEAAAGKAKAEKQEEEKKLAKAKSGAASGAAAETVPPPKNK